ncbi:MAG: proliferating cell nuclear antigen (pcna) [Nanoarchaeota archaeon]|nr:proliferating cell nuclear antigen (pcna) [Nanoarchaeota archaeon]
MRLTLAEPSYLKESISIISELVSEAKFTITKDAIELIAMDPANVAMVVFKLFSSCFTEYDIKEDTSIAINLGNLKQVLRRVTANDMLTLELEKNKLKLEFTGSTKRTFHLPILEIEEKEQKVPELTFPVTITCSPSVFTSAIEDADIVAESVTFVVEKGKFMINASGDLSDAAIEIPASDSVKIETGEEVIKSKYSIEYLKKMVAGSKISNEVSIQFNKDYPLKLSFKEVDKVLLSFILAPRVEND